ncbi:methyltransferase domain-containing protein [Sphingomonas sp. Root241]|uniref:methyltransferase domain-containing protein n=1 Tax=Sphingomonas sp. Root241 TaxID=1736501 RepID=UPI001910138A
MGRGCRRDPGRSARLARSDVRGLEELRVEEAAAFGGDSILDIGCGTGSTTLAITRAVGPRANCVGIDVSGPMLAAAKAAASWEGSRITRPGPGRPRLVR